MKLSELKEALAQVETIAFQLPNEVKVPPHFHVTEVGLIHKKFIDCGGVMRDESVINFQLYTATDYDHRLGASKLKSIIELSELKLSLPDLEIEVEYQAETIGKYALDFQEGVFMLKSKFTDCLAKDNCGIPQTKPRIRISSNTEVQNSCAPGSGCC